jgi:hypothetical protein
MEEFDILEIPVYEGQRATCSLQKKERCQFVGVLVVKYACARNPVSHCFTLELTSKTYSLARGATGPKRNFPQA